ncbi:hypothetical protein AB0D12_06525 [Streptomyces sp. NPDC048479]|uniref:hypothetical protein n=1 Tax=Streptomyces sp. NPDC048479 TaxID=3154725 RepID=UPI00343B275C
MADPSGTDSSSGFDGAASTGQGRAARRRQLARWKKNRRRAVAATAVALVGGGLTVAALPTTRPSTSHTHAASPPEPVTADMRTATADSSLEQPDTPASRHPSTRPPTTTNRQHSTTVATPPTATTSRQQNSAATARPLAAPSATPHITAESAKRATHVGKVGAPAPDTTAPPAPASTERPGADTPAATRPPSTSPGNPTSPTQVCLIVLCIG